MLQRYAVISDIHGNSWALEEVLRDIAARNIKHILNLGDLLYGPLDPEGTALRLQHVAAITVQGNEDRLIYERCDQQPPNPTLGYVRGRLSEEQMAWLQNLPYSRIAYDDLFLCHGTPDNDHTYLVEDVSPGIPQLHTNVFLRDTLRDISQSVVLCGHSHLQQTVSLPDGRLIVNPGSVGLPAYHDDNPVSHVMETGSPHASYSVLTRLEQTWHVEHIKIAYDWEQAAQCAARHQRLDWAAWLRTGRASS